MDPIRMKKYNSRKKNPSTLKWLSIITVKEYFYRDDIEKFINKIEIDFN